MVWGSITFQWVLQSLMLKGIIKEDAYPTILEISQAFPQEIFQDGNVPCHTVSVKSLIGFT